MSFSSLPSVVVENVLCPELYTDPASLQALVFTNKQNYALWKKSTLWHGIAKAKHIPIPSIEDPKLILQQRIENTRKVLKELYVDTPVHVGIASYPERAADLIAKKIIDFLSRSILSAARPLGKHSVQVGLIDTGLKTIKFMYKKLLPVAEEDPELWSALLATLHTSAIRIIGPISSKYHTTIHSMIQTIFLRLLCKVKLEHVDRVCEKYLSYLRITPIGCQGVAVMTTHSQAYGSLLEKDELASKLSDVRRKKHCKIYQIAQYIYAHLHPTLT